MKATIHEEGSNRTLEATYTYSHTKRPCMVCKSETIARINGLPFCLNCVHPVGDSEFVPET